VADGKALQGRDRTRVILTPDQRLRVFVSSTLRELREERAAVRAAISQLSLTPVMFELGARPHPPRALYRSYLDQSDVFVGIYWESYGWVAPGESVSGLEDEYRLSAHLPRLLYVKEPAPNREPKLAALLKQIQTDDTASYRSFATPEELAQLLTGDLMLMLTEQFQAAAHEEPAREPVRLRLTPPAEPLTALVGREQEAESLRALIRDGSRLVTVTGTGGVGKSRLAVEVARRCHKEFGIDVHFVDLTPLSSAEAVLSEIARSLGIPSEGTTGPMASLIDHLASRRLLLLLDNFEHVAAAATHLPELLSACGDLQVLVTSRQVLRLRGETEFPLAPLPVPSTGAPADEVRSNPAVMLFVQRAHAAQPSFDLTAENLEPVAEISRRLDGLPLAVELAAARVRLLPANLLLDRLESRLDLLSSGAADLPERQRTLWSAIDWSFNLLSPAEQELFCQLAVFVGGWTLEAAEAVCLTTATTNVLDILVSLLEKSLFVVVTAARAGEPRMRMLAPVHQYAEQKLVADGSRSTLQQRHADYFGKLVTEHEAELRGASQEAWSLQLSAESGNLRAAVGWWMTIRDGEALGQFLWATFLHYWLIGDMVREFGSWVQGAYGLAENMSRITLGRLGIVDGVVAFNRLELDDAEQATEKALSILDGVGDESAINFGRLAQGLIASVRGDPSASAAIARVLESPHLGDDPWLGAMAYWTAGSVALFAADLAPAESHFGQALERGMEIANWQVVGLALGSLSFVHLLHGRMDAAGVALEESVDCFRRVRYRVGLAYDLQALATVLSTLGDPHAATQALATADATFKRVGFPLWPAFQPAFDALYEQLRSVLGMDFAETWSKGGDSDVYVAAANAVELVKRQSVRATE
jgi:predicted ATPase